LWTKIEVIHFRGDITDQGGGISPTKGGDITDQGGGDITDQVQKNINKNQ